ncbi:eukaryotic initiation factor 4A isoform X2 [Amborella trichopoda]|uniref:Helicase C-terminal domain-containing protein n=1 Tax=Amborella trichopoda TaxID=13333 RepID=W1NK24_AMBTC|nr:eukaryotic initiation factor 4A isoform X2 [Amborella trichopoda]ERM95806.1 hypothetical protein AMTR_s00060p00020920 [Amborella trichopoda]|eukprot:XP_020531643.1 eukaryotic initiation factor 4A isoform X2 [Amborella trichopoda]
MDAAFTVETQASTSPYHSSCRRQEGETLRQYYVAVDRLQFKMETLVDLLDVIGRRSSLPIVLCCSSRDELDAVCATVSNLSYISSTCMYSDLAESERASILDNFRQVAAQWNKRSDDLPSDQSESGCEQKRSYMMVVTDACLPMIGVGEAPIPARVLINYELPTKKEAYLRRISSCLSADGIVINMVVGGEVITLKSIEESCGIVTEEMPIHISEIL